MRRLCVWCLGFSLALVAPALAQQDLTRDPVAAYVALTKADRARDRGESGAALAAYEEALAKYVSIKKQDPRWHPDIVQYRMAYCANELEKLRRPAAPPAAAAVTAAVPVVQENLQPWLAEKPPVPAPVLPDAERAALQTRIDEVQGALAAVTQEVAQLAAERLALQGERDGLKARVAQLESAPAPAPVVIPPDTAELDRVRGDLEKVTAEAVALQKQVTDLTAARAAADEAATKTEEELKKSAKEAREAEKAKAKSAKEVERLQASLVEAKEELARTQEQASAQLLAAQAKADAKLGPLQIELAELKLALAGLQNELNAAQEKARTAQESLQAAQQEREAERQAAAQAQAQAPQVDTNEVARLTELADTRLRAYEAAQLERDQMAPQLEEVRNSLAATKTALESALADKMALETKLTAAPAEPVVPEPPAAPDDRTADKIKALQETIDLQEKEMGRVREYKKQVAALEKQLREGSQAAPNAPDQGALDQLNGQIKSLTRQLQAARDEAARRDEVIRAMEAEAAARKKGG